MYAILVGSNFWMVVFLEPPFEVVMPDGFPSASSSKVNNIALEQLEGTLRWRCLQFG
jgi:hypothetical protein